MRIALVGAAIEESLDAPERVVGMTRRLADGRVEVYGGTALERELKQSGRLVGSYFGYTYRIADAVY